MEVLRKDVPEGRGITKTRSQRDDNQVKVLCFYLLFFAYAVRQAASTTVLSVEMASHEDPITTSRTNASYPCRFSAVERKLFQR